MADFIQSRGMAAFGTRLRRLSEALDREVQGLYRDHGADFSPRWYPVVTALAEHDALSVGELAALIGITHAAVSQVRRELISRGLIRVTADPADRRRQMLALTAKGRRQVEKLSPLWDAIAQATTALCAEVAPEILSRIDSIETALAGRSLAERVQTVFAPPARQSRSKEKTNA